MRILLFALLCVATPAVGAELQCVGCPAHAPEFEAAVSAAGLSVVRSDGASVEALIRRGGCLLVALDPHTAAAALQLTGMLPSTVWRVKGKLNDGAGPDGAIRAVEWDAEMFASNEPRGIELPYHFRIRPFDAVERGEGRYERFARNTLWTRPLINRDWRVRVRGGGVEQIPLLITGRYGAGRVAVFAAAIDSISPPTSARSVWGAVLRWLAGAQPAGLSAQPVAIAKIETAPESHAVRITVKRAFDGVAVVRARTWERAISGDYEQRFSGTTVTIPLPRPSATNYQALDARDAYDLRIGILSADGSQLLEERISLADFRPALELSIHTPDVRPEEPRLVLFNSRMGMPITRYSYRPGEPVAFVVSLRNGLRNVAPLATASSPALNDEAGIAEKPPIDGIDARGTWNGRAGEENVLTFQFPTAQMVTAVTLVGSPDNYRNLQRFNPPAAVVEIDGTIVARGRGLDRIEFPARAATILRVHLPPSAQEPRLAEVLIDGVLPSTPVNGDVRVQVRDSLTGEVIPAGETQAGVDPGKAQELSFTAKLARPGHYVLEASFAGQRATAPIMVIDPVDPLLPLSQLRSPDAPQMGFIVTRGFRNVFDIGTGTREDLGGWGQPDDLIWAYSRQLKQIGRNARTAANRLYLTESDLRHYSTPWRSFPDGQSFYELGAPKLVERMKKLPNWNKSDTAFLGHSDRWDTAPDVNQLYGWQDFIDFDDYLRSRGPGGLKGKTRQELAAEIHERYDALWQDWHLKRYIKSLEELREAFAAEHKKLLISAQGAPLVPLEDQEEVANVIRGESDDCTWGMVQESIPATTGRQMGVMAFDPAWRMSTLLQWNYDSAILNNPHWHAPAGTTEPSRRHIYDRAFRGVVRPDGSYHSMHTYGFNSNAGASFTTTANDWQEWWRVSDRHSLIAPDGPIGAGIVISTARFSDPRKASFSGSGGWGKSAADAQVRDVSNVVRALHDAGISISFSANAAYLDKWTGTAPLILLDVCEFSNEEIGKVRALVSRGVRVAAFPGDCVPSIAEVTMIPGSTSKFTNLAALDLAPRLMSALAIPIQFPPGTSGYGFTSQGLDYIVLEDWREEGRTVHLRLRATAGVRSAHATDVNDNRTLLTSRDGGWWVIDAPVRPGDGALICLEEDR